MSTGSADTCAQKKSRARAEGNLFTCIYAKAPCPPAQQTPARKKKVVLVLKEICLHASYAKKRLCLCLSKIIVYMHVWNLVTGDFWWANGAMPTGSADKQMLVLVFIG